MSARMAASTRCMFALKDVFRKRWLPRAAKVEIYTKIIRPILMYGCDLDADPRDWRSLRTEFYGEFAARSSMERKVNGAEGRTTNSAIS